MFADRIRGGAGIVFAILGLLLLRSGPGISESAAAAGCRDDANCYAETLEEGIIGPEGWFITSHMATCQGGCLDGRQCEPINSQDVGGFTTFQCSCDSNLSPASCSGFPKIGSDGQVESFSCKGDCGTLSCAKHVYNIVTDSNCPTGYSRNWKCICE
jgi:hypothetical protein